MTDWEGFDARMLAGTCEILRVRAGSHAYGTNVATSDEDYFGVMCEPKAYVMGLSTFDTWDNNSGEGKNGPGDIDLTIHSVRKFLRLACGGNPNILEKFFTHPDDILHNSPGGELLMTMGPMFATRKAAKAYIGYMQAQRMKASGERTQRTQRPDLIGEHGFDTKFAMHMVRLGYMGYEYLRHGRISMPVRVDIRDLLLKIRGGGVPLNDCLAMSVGYEDAIYRILDSGQLPPEPNYREVNKRLIEIHEWWWSFCE